MLAWEATMKLIIRCIECNREIPIEIFEQGGYIALEKDAWVATVNVLSDSSMTIDFLCLDCFFLSK